MRKAHQKPHYSKEADCPKVAVCDVEMGRIRGSRGVGLFRMAVHLTRLTGLSAEERAISRPPSKHASKGMAPTTSSCHELTPATQ
eukprot:4853940-Pleurochrysis_carterae.AAC.1